MKKFLLITTVFSILFYVNAQSTSVLYGLNARGGDNGVGVIFKYDPTTEAYTKQYSFSLDTGAYPYGGMMQASNSKLYGMTYYGGSNSTTGVFFEYDITDGRYTVIKELNGSQNGSYPQGSIPIEVDGKLYGMTYYGGQQNYGVIFEYDLTTKDYKIKYNFGQSMVDARAPYGSLTFLNGKLYGLSTIGGTTNRGALFEYNLSDNSLVVKHSFMEDPKDGRIPYGSLTVYDGKLYGMTNSGGNNNMGIIFEYNPVGSIYKKTYDFTEENGNSPNGDLSLFQGKLYGITPTGGGGDSRGVLFSYDPVTQTYAKKIRFTTPNNGQYPLGSLSLSSNGKMYGLTNGDYESGSKGVLFEYDPITNLYLRKFDIGGDNGYPSFYNRMVEVRTNTLTAIEDTTTIIKLYPNPVEDVLHLQDITKAIISVYNTTGQLQLRQRISNGQVKFTGLPKGVYFVKVEEGSKVSHHKVLKK